MYYLYHIPNKKIGVTRNLNKRVTEQQGYTPDEYEVLLTSEDINLVSSLEIELQKSLGYKVDRQSYKNLINKTKKKMRINITEQTTTFPCPVRKLKGRLMDNIGMEWETSHGSVKLDSNTVNWIVKHANTSMYNTERCYIYNKALAMPTEQSTMYQEYDDTIEQQLKYNYVEPDPVYAIRNHRFDLIRKWADERGIYDKGDLNTQYVKLQEEAGELAKALLNKDHPEIVDAIGDIVVVLTNLAHLAGHKIEDCIDTAYDVIAKRQGKMINGTFVKDKEVDELIRDFVKSTL
jgi:NTP pyrophosphatase (non-canonical NTP hydrolase)